MLKRECIFFRNYKYFCRNINANTKGKLTVPKPLTKYASFAAMEIHAVTNVQPEFLLFSRLDLLPVTDPRFPVEGAPTS